MRKGMKNHAREWCQKVLHFCLRSLLCLKDLLNARLQYVKVCRLNIFCTNILCRTPELKKHWAIIIAKPQKLCIFTKYIMHQKQMELQQRFLKFSSSSFSLFTCSNLRRELEEKRQIGCRQGKKNSLCSLRISIAALPRKNTDRF